ncbi:MAG: acyl-CoA dehydrogenase-like [Moraxellaceae bacterium]|jgi:putative acyl-CoA dehydrogenase|nr:acyl-CoA dehydrogenase-like [Moraxellaceae bacterium]
MNAHHDPIPGAPFVAATHDVFNVSSELQDYNLYTRDTVLQEAVLREGGGHEAAALSAFGEMIGRAGYLELGDLANRHAPEFDTHDRFGHRVDLVKFHPAYHQLMQTSIEQGLHASPWTNPGKGAHVARAARFFLHSQIEAGHGCPVTMTFAAVPSLRVQPELAALWEAKITSRVYDPRNIPAQEKAGVTVGMGMTEKQGGSDVRANTTRAWPVGDAYELVGHKFFLSAPMCDLFLVLAQAPGGLTCFLVPRWRPDGSKNPLEVLRLKEKMGNRSNASSEIELRGALAWRVGEEGRGVRTIIEMVSMTRFDCMIGSSAGMRMALSQAIHHCQQRAAFGRKLIDQPLMRNVLADLALESEAATTLTLRMARAMDNRHDEHEDLLVRIATAVGKYWICKRTPNHAYEAMECIGGSGVMENSMFPRLFRESPVNAIWEGSGNVQCLDVLRAMQKTPAVVEAFVVELKKAKGGNAALDAHVSSLLKEFVDPADFEVRARDVVDRMAVALQAALLVQHAPAAVADAFCRSRLEVRGQHNYGVLPRDTDFGALLARAWPAA